jgi:hypothetical protein
MEGEKMRIRNILLTGLAPLILMAYGWYLGQLHQSGYDIAGILLFVTGLVGLGLGFILRRFARKAPWHERWYASLLTGMTGCGMVFALILLYARLHG